MSEEKQVYPTAFLMLKEPDGSWRAVLELPEGINVEAPATRLDVRLGCQEIANVISQQDLAATVLSFIQENSYANTQREEVQMSDASSGVTPEN